ncbi:MAG: cysteine desulfurase family protein [Anaerolineae bacterium]|nr:cysteine desulfurase [Caldilineales bacterium]MDW8267814.1 cysteine desulfurase family protein [Anaerolineae bacterium]
MPDRTIYLDHAATTPVSPTALAAMLPYFGEIYGNASGIYRQGRLAKQALEEARRTVAEVLHAHPSEVVFTSCGSESDNLVLRGIMWAALRAGRGRHLIISAVEHKAVLETAHQLAELFDCEVTELPVDGYGRVDPDDLRRAIRPDTALISIMTANNEVGTLQPIAALAAVAHAYGIPFHTDAVQAPGHLPLDVQALGVDALALSGHKFYGPKGVGVTWLRSGLSLVPVQTGGSHEGKRRAGTENVAGIVGLAAALREAEDLRPAETTRLLELRNRLLDAIPALIPNTRISGHPHERLPHHASFLFAGIEIQGVLMGLDMAGIAASSGSACTSAAQTPSHVLTAMGVSAADAVGHLRLTLGRSTTAEDIEEVLRVLPPLVQRLRRLQSGNW